MNLLPLAWTLWTVSLTTAVQILLTEPTNILYPKIGSSENIECGCANISCDSVLWFHTNPSQGKVRFIGRHNNADRVTHGALVEKERFKMNKRGTSFVLRISKLTQNDTGIYSCVVNDKSNTNMWRPGSLLLPGVAPPTLPPVTKPKPPVKPICTCKKNSSRGGCGSLVLWPLVGLIAGLALALICTLYYFSRLPKKCRHHFGKRGK